MIYPSIDKLLNIVDSKYELVHIAARRSKQISRDGYLQMPESEYKSSKNIGRALEEVAEKLIEVKKKGEQILPFSFGIIQVGGEMTFENRKI